MKDRITFLNDYEDFIDWCEKACDALIEHEILESGYDFEYAVIWKPEYEIEFTLSKYAMGETDYIYYHMPIEVFMEDSLDEYIAKIVADRELKMEIEKQETYECGRKMAIEKIKELKEKYNL